MNTGSSVLQITKLKKNFAIKNKEITALENVDLDVERGEFISIVGPSGCGKSTLLRVIIGLEDISSGRIQIDGEDINGPNPKVSMIYQEARLFPWLSVEKNIKFVLPSGMSAGKKQELADEYIELVGLQGFKNALPGQLSGGMQQRVSIARGLVGNPEILLMDEPFGALDAFTRMKMQRELLRIWREQGNTIILVTHDIDEAIFLSSKIVIMTERPGTIQKIIPVEAGYPRDRKSAYFMSLRAQILEFFLKDKTDQVEYYI